MFGFNHLVLRCLLFLSFVVQWGFASSSGIEPVSSPIANAFRANGLTGWSADFVGHHKKNYKPILEWRYSAEHYKDKQLFLSVEDKVAGTFFYLEKKFDGLVPGIDYRVILNMDYFTKANAHCVKRQGLKSPHVNIKIGATNHKPVLSVSEPIIGDVEQWVVKQFKNFDHGKTHSASGDNTTLPKPMAYYSEQENIKCEQSGYQRKPLRVDHHDSLIVSANDKGEVYVIIGLHSFSMTVINLYIDKINVDFLPVSGIVSERFPYQKFPSI